MGGEQPEEAAETEKEEEAAAAGGAAGSAAPPASDAYSRPHKVTTLARMAPLKEHHPRPSALLARKASKVATVTV